MKTDSEVKYYSTWVQGDNVQNSLIKEFRKIFINFYHAGGEEGEEQHLCKIFANLQSIWLGFAE